MPRRKNKNSLRQKATDIKTPKVEKKTLLGNCESVQKLSSLAELRILLQGKKAWKMTFHQNFIICDK